MECPSPIRITHGKSWDFVPCGKCAICLENRAKEWTFRLKQELKNSESAYFITLTYDQENVPVGDNCLSLSKRDFQLFIKRLRKKVGTRISYYAVGEYGSNTERPHYHAIIFNLPITKLTNKTELEASSYLNSIWNQGFVHIGDCTGASIHYVTSYIINKYSDKYEGREKPFSLMSRRPAIGFGWLESNQAKYCKTWLKPVFNSSDGKMKLPRIYKEKIFSIKQREKIKENTRIEMFKKFQAEFQEAQNRKADYFSEKILKIEDKKRKIQKRNKKIEI